MLAILKNMKRSGFILSFLMWSLIGVGVLLRTIKADAFPINNNDDGLFYVWAGSSFLEHPFQVRSHTIFDSHNKALFWRSQYQDFIPHLRFGMKIVQPWFDHPPLGTILISLPAHFLGYRQVDQIPHILVRFPSLIASIFTLLLTFLFAKKIFSKQTAFFALLFMATVPYFVFAHRQSYLENMLTPIFLAATIFFIEYQEKKKKVYLYLAAFFAFCCGWIKIPAFGIPFVFLGWSLYKKEFYAVKVFLAAGILSVLTYLLYGFTADKEFFLATLTNQGVRGMYLSSFLFSFVKPMFYGDFMDGQYILGLLICFSFLLQKDKTDKENYFSWLFMGWICILFLVSGKFNNSPWYRYPLLPFMAIGLGHMASLLWTKRSIFTVVVFGVFALSGFDLAGFEFSSSVLRLGFLLMFFPFALFFLFPKQKIAAYLSRAAVVVLLGTIVVANIMAILRYPRMLCEQEPCLLPEKIILKEK